ncbi:hypothetical protein [Staphylococcus ureilyticus]
MEKIKVTSKDKVGNTSEETMTTVAPSAPTKEVTSVKDGSNR